MASDPADQLPPVPRFVSVPIHTYFSYDPEGLRDYLNKHQELEQKLRMRYLFGLLGARIAAGSKDPKEPAGTKNPEKPEDSEDANESERSKDAKESTGAKHAHEIGHILFDLAPGEDSLYRCRYVTEGWGLTEVHVQHIPFDEEKEMSNLEFWEEICGFNPQLVPSPYPFSKAYGLFGRYGRYEGVIHELCSHDLSKTVAHFCCPVESLEPAYCKGESQSSEKRPLMMIWEPYFEGKFCVPKNLEKIKKACGQFDVVITNHVDLQAMFSEEPGAIILHPPPYPPETPCPQPCNGDSRPSIPRRVVCRRTATSWCRPFRYGMGGGTGRDAWLPRCVGPGRTRVAWTNAGMLCVRW
jgi:hypothetical protein